MKSEKSTKAKIYSDLNLYSSGPANTPFWMVPLTAGYLQQNTTPEGLLLPFEFVEVASESFPSFPLSTPSRTSSASIVFLALQ